MLNKKQFKSMQVLLFLTNLQFRSTHVVNIQRHGEFDVLQNLGVYALILFIEESHKL